jgi:hypothetical protein
MPGMAIARNHHLAFVLDHVDEAGPATVRYAYFKAVPASA